TKVWEPTECDPAKSCGHRNLSHMHGIAFVDLLLQPVVAGHQLFDVAIPQRRVAQLCWSSLDFPAHSDAGVGDALRGGLETQDPPAGLARLGNQPRPVVQRVEVGANHIRIEDCTGMGTQKYGNLAKWVLGEDLD